VAIIGVGIPMVRSLNTQVYGPLIVIVSSDTKRDASSFDFVVVDRNGTV
jgi:hypothetical protein